MPSTAVSLTKYTLGRCKMQEAVILLNADYSPLNVVQVRRAIKLLVKKKAVVVEATKRIITNAERTVSFLVPKVIRLVDYIKQLRRYVVTWTKKNILMRDGYTCQYCGDQAQKLTIDHVFPESRGGKTDFDNTVAACLACNNKKANKTPDEAGMQLLSKPHKPSLIEFAAARMKYLGYSGQLDFGKMA